MDDEDIKLAAAHAIEFLSTNIKIKKQLADNDALIKIMVRTLTCCLCRILYIGQRMRRLRKLLGAFSRTFTNT